MRIATRLVENGPHFAEIEVRGHRPILAVEVDIEQIYFHWARAVLRSGLWSRGRCTA